MRTQVEFQVARPQTPSWWGSSSSGSPSSSQRPLERQSPPAHDRRRTSGSLLFQPRGGREGDAEAYRLVCSEDFEHHVLQFLTHQALSGGQSPPEGLEGSSGDNGGDQRARAGTNSSSNNVGPAFKIYSPDQQVNSAACDVYCPSRL